MAIKQDIFAAKFNITAPGAYIKLAYLRWSDVDLKVIATFSVWATRQDMLDGNEVIESIELDFTDAFPGIQKKLYDKIKTLAAYSSAVDV